MNEQPKQPMKKKKDLHSVSPTASPLTDEQKAAQRFAERDRQALSTFTASEKESEAAKQGLLYPHTICFVQFINRFVIALAKQNSRDEALSFSILHSSVFFILFICKNLKN